MLEKVQELLDQKTGQSYVLAKGMLLDSLNNPLLQMTADGGQDDMQVLAWLDDIKCARALIYHKLGEVQSMSVLSEADVEQALESLQKTLEYFESVSNEGVKLKFLNVL